MSFEFGFNHLYRPPTNHSKRTLLVLHGTGGDENSLVPVAQAIDPAAGLLSVRGKILENGAPRFFRRLEEGVFDLEDLNVRTHELADFVESARIEYHFDVEKIVAVGYSNGANIASSMLFLRPESLSTAILLRGMVPFEPAHAQDLSSKRIFISAGQFDPIVPVEQVDRLAHLFRERQASVTLRWNALDHRVSKPELESAAEWLSQA